MAEAKKKGEEEKKKNEGKIIMEARIHCNSTKAIVREAILGYPGVEEIEDINVDTKKVTLKAPKVDAKKLFDTVKKRSGGRITKLIHPDPKDLEKAEKEKEKERENKEKKEPVDVTVELKVHMHCNDCKKKVDKIAWSIKDVSKVQPGDGKVTIVGKDLDPKKVCDQVKKKLSCKHVEIIPPKKDNDDKPKKTGDPDKLIVSGPHGYTYVLPSNEVYVYPPQYFSDDNPNACTIM